MKQARAHRQSKAKARKKYLEKGRLNDENSRELCVKLFRGNMFNFLQGQQRIRCDQRLLYELNHFTEL